MLITIKKGNLLLFVFIICILVVTYVSYNSLVLEAFSFPTTQKVIVIDAGHGGWDPVRYS